MNWVARIFMGLLGLAFLAGLALALGVYIVFATLRWLLTGRKPQVVLVWQQFRQMRQGGPWGADMGSSFGGSPAADDVVDVEVREVREDEPRLPDTR